MRSRQRWQWTRKSPPACHHPLANLAYFTHPPMYTKHFLNAHKSSRWPTQNWRRFEDIKFSSLIIGFVTQKDTNSHFGPHRRTQCFRSLSRPEKVAKRTGRVFFFACLQGLFVHPSGAGCTRFGELNMWVGVQSTNILQKIRQFYIWDRYPSRFTWASSCCLDR
jgi:hypothetical protein